MLFDLVDIEGPLPQDAAGAHEYYSDKTFDERRMGIDSCAEIAAANMIVNRPGTATTFAWRGVAISRVVAA